MSPGESHQQQPADFADEPAIQCDACQSALGHGGRDSLSFLLVDQLTVPLVGCEDHLDQFTEVCGLTTEDTADLLQHRPAGGLTCPGCRLAGHEPEHPMIAVEDGAVAILACPEHRTDAVDRFHTGLQTRQQLTTTLETSNRV